MVLVDTSVWIDFLRRGNATFQAMLEGGKVRTHALVIGELTIGNVANREQFLHLLNDLPMVGECTHEEVLFLIEEHRLCGTGIGYFDAHLLCSAMVHESFLWTFDKRLARQAETLGIGGDCPN